MNHAVLQFCINLWTRASDIINISKPENIKACTKMNPVFVLCPSYFKYHTITNFARMYSLNLLQNYSNMMCVLFCFRRCWPDPSDTVGRRDAFRTVIPINAGANSELPLARVPPLELELGYGRRVEDSGAQTPNPCWQVSWRPRWTPPACPACIW